MENNRYEQFVRSRITELRMANNVSEHRMSLELGKSGSYIRSITNGAALPSLREFFNICQYFHLTPLEFFAPLQEKEQLRYRLIEKLIYLDDDTLEKIDIFLDWIK